MEKKVGRSQGKKRAPNLSLKSILRTPDGIETYDQRSEIETRPMPGTAPVFASVHRPRQANVSFLRKNCDQQLMLNHNQFVLQTAEKHGEGFNFNTSHNTGESGIEENKRNWFFVPNFSQFREQRTVFENYPSEYYNQLNSQQSSLQHNPNGLIVSSQVSSRAPNVRQQQNFAHISKTATNLLHNIYEKHLLSQTTFENVAVLNHNNNVCRPMNAYPIGAGACEKDQHEKIGFSSPINQRNVDVVSTSNNIPQRQKITSVHYNHPYKHMKQQYKQQCQEPKILLQQRQEKNPSELQQNDFCHYNLPTFSMMQNHQKEMKTVQPALRCTQIKDPAEHVYESLDEENATKIVGTLTTTATTKTTTTLSASIEISTSHNKSAGLRSSEMKTQKRRVPGKIQRNFKNSTLLIEDGKRSQNTIVSQENRMNSVVVVGGITNEENHFGKMMHKVQQSNQPKYRAQFYNPHHGHHQQPQQYQEEKQENASSSITNSVVVTTSNQARNKIDTSENDNRTICHRMKTENVLISSSPQQNSACMEKSLKKLFTTTPTASASPSASGNTESSSLSTVGQIKERSARKNPIGSASDAERNLSSAAANGDEFDEHFKTFNSIPEEGIAKFEYRNNKIDLMLETAQAMAAAAYYAKAAQKLAQSGGTSKNRSTDMNNPSRNGGFCGALQRAPPPMPVGLARRLANKENYGIGKVKVMLRVSDNPPSDEEHFMSVDKKKRQVTLTDPTTLTATNCAAASTSQERGPMVSAPKMFAFDSLFTAEDQQMDVCSSALSEVIPAVLEGSDGCLMTIGYPSSGQAKTMLGSINSNNELGAIACAISWLYKGINERRQKSGARFSVRVSALGVSATKPDSSSKDLLAAHATDSDDSPGVYLRDDFLGGPTELRAPTAERAALFLDAALAGRPQSGLEPAMIFTLHVYQYSLSRKGGVAGGRSRLHLIDLGGCANRNGGLPLSGIGNILLAILSGQRHPPNKDHPLTPLLKDCLAPLTCHVAIMAHVSHRQSHTDALTTIQLASRIHRMRRRKHRFPVLSDKALGVNNTGHQSGGSSEGPDPSSSDLSADTVIYMGPSDDATDGEHPPVYLPSLSSGDNRCPMSRVLKGTGVEKPSKIPGKKNAIKSQSPVPHRTDSLKRINVPSSSPTPPSVDFGSSTVLPSIHNSPKNVPSNTSPKIVAGSLRHPGVNKSSNVPTPKGSPLRRPQNTPNPESPIRKISEEQWIDGPRVSRAKVAEARHLLREINHVKQCETWIDGPKSNSPSLTKPLTAGNLTGTTSTTGYGFMDNHKKTMIRQWVENQSTHIFQSSAGSSPVHQGQVQQQQLTQQQQPQQQTQQQQQLQQQPQQPIQQHLRTMTYHLTQMKQKSDVDLQEYGIEMNVNTGISATAASSQGSNIMEVSSRNASKLSLRDETDIISEKSGNSTNVQSQTQHHQQQQFSLDLQNLNQDDQEDQDSGPSEVPPALPLIEPLGSREISHESLQRIISRHVSRESISASQQNIQTIDCGLQVTEEEIARTMGCEHPLSALSHGDVSVVSSFNIGDAFSDCAMGERTRNQFDQLARLREIFTSQLAMAEVTPSFRIGEANSVYSEPAFRFNPGPGSVCSEPAYRSPSPRCRGCRQSRNISRTPSQTSLPSLNGIMTIAGMEQYASLRHPDGASDPNLQKIEKLVNDDEDDQQATEKTALLSKPSSQIIEPEEKSLITDLPIISQPQLPLLPLSTTSEAYDSGHDSSTPRTSKHSGISRRAESGYHSVATARDSDESSFSSAISKEHNRISLKKKRQDKSLCNWLRNPFTCTYPETEGEISDF